MTDSLQSDHGYASPDTEGVRRIRLSEWARRQGISRITAYRMLKRGILPIPSERSPTGRWYVLLAERKGDRVAIYACARPGPRQVNVINEQIASLSEWLAQRNLSVFTVVREIVDPRTGQAPRLERLLADRHITQIVIDHPDTIGVPQYRLLLAALSPQGRTITAAFTNPRI